MPKTTTAERNLCLSNYSTKMYIGHHWVNGEILNLLHYLDNTNGKDNDNPNN